MLDEIEQEFQQRVLSGPPPLGPGAPPVERLIAFGRARIELLFDHLAIARGTLDGRQPAGSSPLSRTHIRVLLGQLPPGGHDLVVLAIQLTAALDAPMFLYLSVDHGDDAALADRLTQGWEDLIRRVCD